MGNWRTVTITGTIGAEDAAAAQEFVELGDDPKTWDRFHCLCWPGPTLCGLGRWIPAGGGNIAAVGNLAERDYDVDDVAETLRRMLTVAPSLDVKVHCGGDWEADACTATVTARAGQVTVGPAEIPTVGEGMDEQGSDRLVEFIGAAREGKW
jgi:hypothetical protein